MIKLKLLLNKHLWLWQNLDNLNLKKNDFSISQQVFRIWHHFVLIG